MKIIGFDIETHLLSPYHTGSRLLTAAVSEKGRSWGVVLDHPLAKVPSSIQGQRILRVQKLLGDPNVTIVGHNIAGFDVPYWEKKTGHPVRAKLFDTRVAYALLDEESFDNHLGALVEKFGLGKKNAEELNRKKLAETDPEAVLRYNISDAELSRKLYYVLVPMLKEQKLGRLFLFLMEVARSLIDMKTVGTRLDLEWVRKHRADITKELEKVQAQLLGWLGDQNFNLNSPKQLAAKLFGSPDDGGFGMPVVERSKKTHAPSTSTDALKAVRAKAKGKEAKKLLDTLLSYRKLTKLLGTYLEPFEHVHMAEDGRIHTTFHLSKGYDKDQSGGTVTGRLSSSEPNLQNIPRDERIKGSFAPSNGHLLFSADYSQIELRVAAWFAGEETMLQAIREGRDMHTATLASLERRPYDEVKALVVAEDKHWVEQRVLIKQVNFSMLYGAGPWRLVKLMQKLGITISLRRAEEIISWWYAEKAAMKAWIDEVHARAVRDKQLVTPTGRVRHLPYAEWGTPWGERALRQSVNFLVQSFSADVMLSALRLLHTRLPEEVDGARLLLTVHDSVIGEYPEKTKADLASFVHRTMAVDAYEYLQERFGVEPGLLLDVDIKAGQDRWRK